MNPLAARRAAAILALVCLSAIASQVRGDTVKFPKDDPSITIDLPSGWRADFIDEKTLPGGNRLQLMCENPAGDLSIKELPESAGVTDDASAKRELSKVAMEDMKSMEATKVGDVSETTVAGHKAYGAMVTTGVGPMFYAIFTPDGETYFSMFSMQGGADAVVKAIKAAE
jgi:hypothetical protein